MAWQDNLRKEVRKMQRQMDRLFGNTWPDRDREEMLDELSTNYRRAFANFKETDKEFIVEVEVPGIEKEDIKLSTTEHGIEIKAEKKHEEESEENGYSYSKSFSGFYRAFDVPDTADLKHIEAEYKGGVLTIKMPKIQRPEHRRTININ